MIGEASLVSRAGVPIWVRSSGPSLLSGVLTGAMLGALSMFSSEITGQLIRTIEMNDGFRLNLRPFGDGNINLAIIGEDDVLSDPVLLQIIDRLDKDINVMVEQTIIDLDDSHTVAVFLEDRIKELDTWFGSKIFIQAEDQKLRDEQVVKISSEIALMSTRFSQDQVAILVLDASLEPLYISETIKISKEFLLSFQSHLRGWVRVSSHVGQLLPELFFFEKVCIGLKPLKKQYLVCGVEWTSSIGDTAITSKIRSWLSRLSRRLGP